MGNWKSWEWEQDGELETVGMGTEWGAGNTGDGAGWEGDSGTAAVGTGTQRAPTAPKTSRGKNLHPEKLLPQFVVHPQNMPGGICSISAQVDLGVILASVARGHE